MNSPCTLFELLASTSPDALSLPAIHAPGRQSLSRQGLIQHLRVISSQLNRLGLRAGDRAALVLPNSAEAATAFLAVSSVCTCAPLNPAYQVDEFKASMEALQVKILLALPAPDSPARKAALALGVPVIDLLPDEKVAGIFSLAGLPPADPDQGEAHLAGVEDVALVLQTSGTTSRPKTVPLTHRNIFHSCNNIAETYALTPDDICLNMMPLFHIHGLMAAVAASLARGASVICSPGFQPDHVMDWLSDLEPTWYTAVPTMHQAILEQARRHPQALAKLKLRFIRSCSSSLAPQVATELEDTFGVPVLEAYGMTEGTHQIASNPLPPRPHKFGSVGLATGTTRVAILDEKGQPLAANQVGEICICGENVMSGYENNPAANAANFFGEWLRTGDRGYLDDDGYLFIQGRLKELINRGGEKISPREIDEVLLRHPAVRQAVAFAVPHPTLGEDVGAAIVLKDGQSLSISAVRQFAAASLADFKVPRQVVFVAEIPKGPTGKVQRIGLAEKLQNELKASQPAGSGGISATTALEADLLAIWKLVLENDTLGISDDFLSLGGESIQAARILTRVNDKFSLDLQMSDIFSASTVALMAELVKSKKDASLQE